MEREIHLISLGGSQRTRTSPRAKARRGSGGRWRCVFVSASEAQREVAEEYQRTPVQRCAFFLGSRSFISVPQGVRFLQTNRNRTALTAQLRDLLPDILSHSFFVFSLSYNLPSLISGDQFEVTLL